ncbi:MAG: substrate-binding domain-containing protein [Longicatena sp.]|jgi:D-xylose transport system substrate-binding protein|uniref:sugar ABC transporter substrate-binding protein n=1 Tax=Anaerorhabdus sp. TaxID=1872524 RepID=UPI002FCA5AF7
MIKKILIPILVLSCILTLSGCSKKDKKVFIGVSLGVGEATRWVNEKKYMEEKASELGAKIEVRLNKTDKPLTQTEDCIEMIDSGIDVLIIAPRDATNTEEIISYAKSKNVPVISYSRTILNQPIDLVVGYDSNRIGQAAGQYLSELVYEGDYIILKGDPSDSNTEALYEGAMRYIEPLGDNINIILNEYVPGWSVDEAKRIVKETIENHGNVDAILAPNDKLAGACADVVSEMGIEHHVAITGTDAELDALKRIVNGTQDLTINMDLRSLANTAIIEAFNIATLGEPTSINTQVDNGYEKLIDAHLITGTTIIKQNIDHEIIEKNIYTHEQLYGN